MHNVRDEAIIKQFDENLKTVRKAKGLTQEELSYRSDLALSQIARIETGKLNTSICTVYRLAEAMEISPKELF